MQIREVTRKVASQFHPAKCNSRGQLLYWHLEIFIQRIFKNQERNDCNGESRTNHQNKGASIIESSIRHDCGLAVAVGGRRRHLALRSLSIGRYYPRASSRAVQYRCTDAYCRSAGLYFVLPRSAGPAERSRVAARVWSHCAHACAHGARSRLVLGCLLFSRSPRRPVFRRLRAAGDDSSGKVGQVRAPTCLLHALQRFQWEC